MYICRDDMWMLNDKACILEHYDRAYLVGLPNG